MYTHLQINSKILNLAPQALFISPPISPPTGEHQLSLSFQERFGEVGDNMFPLLLMRGLGRGGDLGGKNLRDETQETYVYAVGYLGRGASRSPLRQWYVLGQKSY